MSRVDFDSLASVITPGQLAKSIGAKPASSGNDFHCSSPTHEHGDQKPSLSIHRGERADGRELPRLRAQGITRPSRLRVVGHDAWRRGRTLGG